MTPIEMETAVLRAFMRSMQEDAAPPMFHGTDRALLEMEEGERGRLLQACELISRELYGIFRDRNFEALDGDRTEIARCERALGKRVMSRLTGAYCSARGIAQGYTLYGHGALYLTTDPNKAASYASRSMVCGEMGFTAYWLYWCAARLGYVMPEVEGWDGAIALLREAAGRRPDPVVVMVPGIDKGWLACEDGKEIAPWLLDPQDYFPGLSFRCEGGLDLLEGTVITYGEAAEFSAVFKKCLEAVQGKSHAGVGNPPPSDTVDDVWAEWRLPLEP